jgi:hypothetical protein
MNKIKHYLPSIILLGLFIFLSLDVDAQCAMCRAAAETAHAEGSKDVAGLNKGILMLFLAPFIIIGTITYLWRKNVKQEA